jgi:(2S)-methylsuccinyl-CoA dehydrogenase
MERSHPRAPSEFLHEVEALIEASCRALKQRCTCNGKIDERQVEAHQSVAYDLAFSSAELEAARCVLAYCRHAGSDCDFALDLAEFFVADSIHAIRGRLSRYPGDFGLKAADVTALFDATPLSSAVESRLALSSCRQLGAILLERGGILPASRLSDEHQMIRESFARFADTMVAPAAQSIHRGDLDIPATLLAAAADIGLFAVCIPQRYGGLKPDNAEDTLAMIVVTEELSRASLGAAGSLLTRPEIVARALSSAGTEEQRQYWMPKLAAGEALAAVAITEPNHGSDVAGIRLRATRAQGGWRLDGQKTWCTFAGKASVLLVLARTHPDLAMGHRGLTLFLVPKPAFAGHEFTFVAPDGGSLTGKSIPTIGYRGMHSYDLFFNSMFVPDANVVGAGDGVGRGFYATMQGFAGGRIQTAARATGVMQAALTGAFAYAQQRRVFGKSVSEYPLTVAKLLRMAALLLASREFTHAVAALMDRGPADMQASLVKLFSCRAAEYVTREAMQIHGGIGYAEASDVSRYYVDARVLSIFEGAEETLALKVVARDLIKNA